MIYRTWNILDACTSGREHLQGTIFFYSFKCLEFSTFVKMKCLTNQCTRHWSFQLSVIKHTIIKCKGSSYSYLTQLVTQPALFLIILEIQNKKKGRAGSDVYGIILWLQKHLLIHVSNPQSLLADNTGNYCWSPELLCLMESYTRLSILNSPLPTTWKLWRILVDYSIIFLNAVYIFTGEKQPKAISEKGYWPHCSLTLFAGGDMGSTASPSTRWVKGLRQMAES